MTRKRFSQLLLVTLLTSLSALIILSVHDLSAGGLVPPGYSQSVILTQATGAANDRLGAIVSMDDAGDTVAAIATGVSSFAGDVVVFEKQGATWVQTLEINPPVVDFVAAASVAISGDGKTIVVGTCWNAVCLGKALVYEKSGATWTGATLAATLTPSDPLSGSRFGIAVAIDQAGDTVATGAPCESTAANNSSKICGAVYVYAKPAGGWADETETAKLTVAQPAAPVCPVTPTLGQEFNEVPMLGFSVAIDAAGDVIATGAPDQIGCGPNGAASQIFVQGAAYVFLKPAGAWTTKTTPSATLLANGGVLGDMQGYSVAMSGDGNTVVSGAPAQVTNTNSTIPAGAAYVFTTTSHSWSGQVSEKAKLTASDGVAGDFLGNAVAASMDGSTVLAGSEQHTVAGSGSIAVTYAFLKPSSSWSSKTQDQELDPAAGTDINGGAVTPGKGCGGFLPAPFLSMTPDGADIGMGVCAATVASHAGQGGVFVFALPAAPATITATSGTPQSTMVNTAFGSLLKATVKDASSNPIEGATVTFTAPAQSGPSGTFAGGVNTATTDANGVAASAMFTANGHAGGPYSVTASVAGVTTPASFMLTNTPGAAAAITATGGTPQSAQVNTAFANKLQATVADGGGNPVPDVVVTFTAPAQTGASGTFAGGVNTATTDASGVATSAVFTANGNAGGPYMVAATVAGVTAPANFALTNTAAAGDFTLTSVSATPPSTAGSTNSATVTAGSSAMYVFNLTSLNGFNSAVSLSAAFSGTAAAHTGFSFDKTSVTPSTSGVQATLTVTTQARRGTRTAMSPPAAAPPTLLAAFFGAVPALIVVAILLGKRTGRPGLVASAVCIGIVIVAIAGSGCGGGKPSRGHGTGAGTYMIKVTGTGGSGTPITHTATVTLVVQ